MGKKNLKQTGKERLDKYYYLAKEYGFRSRAAFKLMQLNKKYDFFSNCNFCLDLCSAPGGWLQVARKYMPLLGTVIGVDLSTIRKIPNVITLVGDITTKKCLSNIKTELRGNKCNVVLHDGSPNLGSNWLKDSYTQSELVLLSLKIACEVLIKGGLFLTKVFRSKDYNSLMWLFNQFFEKVEATKPQASRYSSAEIYVICLNFKAPKEIDQKLFDQNFIFEEVTKKKKLKIEFQKKKRNREGYDEDNNLMFHKESPVSKFIECENPIYTIVEFQKFHFEDESDKIYLNHPDTTNEIKLLLQDTQLLGRVDFK